MNTVASPIVQGGVDHETKVTRKCDASFPMAEKTR